MPDAPSYEQLVELVNQLRGQMEALGARNAELERLLAEKVDQIAALRRRLGQDSSTSSRVTRLSLCTSSRV